MGKLIVTVGKLGSDPGTCEFVMFASIQDTPKHWAELEDEAAAVSGPGRYVVLEGMKAGPAKALREFEVRAKP